MNGRCSLAEAFELLAPDLESKAAAAAIEHAAHSDDHFPLYCNGKVVKAGIAKHITVVPESEDGPADILWNGPGLGWAPRAYDWELDVDAVLALKPQPDTRVESAQATAIAALEKAEAATAETASVRAELEKALEEARAEARATRERADAAEKQAEALEARLEAMTLPSTDNPRRHRPPGPKPARNWQEHVLCVALRACNKGRPLPSGPDLAQSCLDNLNLEVDVSAINKLLRDVLKD